MKTTAKWQILALVVGAVLLGGCVHDKTATEPKDANSGAPATEVSSKPDFGDNPASANTDGTGGVTDEQLDEAGRKLQSELQPIFFAFDKYELSQESRDTLTANARALRESPQFAIWIEGHCDERGTNEYNLALGDRRARAARDFLVAAGVASDRMSVISYGEEKPTVIGHDESAWAQNRRDNFKVKGRGIGG